MSETAAAASTPSQSPSPSTTVASSSTAIPPGATIDSDTSATEESATAKVTTATRVRSSPLTDEDRKIPMIDCPECGDLTDTILIFCGHLVHQLCYSLQDKNWCPHCGARVHIAFYIPEYSRRTTRSYRC